MEQEECKIKIYKMKKRNEITGQKTIYSVNPNGINLFCSTLINRMVAGKFWEFLKSPKLRNTEINQSSLV